MAKTPLSAAPSASLETEDVSNQGHVFDAVSSATGLRRGPVRRWFWQVRRNKKAFIGTLMLIILIGVAVMAPFLAPYEPEQLATGPPLTQPRSGHLLGTDNYGRDVLSRMVYGARISLVVAFVVSAGAASIGVSLGLITGYKGGVIDFVIMRLIDMIFTFPWALIALAVAAILGPGLNTVIIALIIVYSPILTRLTRSVALGIRELEYVDAARVVGQSDLAIMLRCVLPNSSSPILVQATSIMGFSILAEAAISYIGLGTRAPTPSWGLSLSEGSNYMWVAPHLVIFPGLAIVYVVLALNLLGDGLRDILDPRYRT
jgi:ABC-type dipeptide/oligopeptide/nickel transport system permease subunit